MTTKTRKPKTNKRTGAALVYMSGLMVVMAGFVSFGVDFGRVQLCKTELQRAADAGARYGAAGLKNILSGVTAARTNAVLAAGDNTADGTRIVIDPLLDVELIIWDSVTKTATVTVDPEAANAVRVTASRTAARGNAVPLLFARVLGMQNCDVSATSIAMLTPGESATYTVPATSNPFLSGMPPGSVASLNNPHNSPDYAGTTSTPKQSPITNTVSLAPGASMTFDGINGSANNDINDPSRYSADGNVGNIQSNSSGNDNGIANTNAPLNCLVAVFLNDSQPSTTSAPSKLNFSTASSRDFTSLTPQLKQVFFIGDGRTSDGQVQQFTVPAGATRLFIGTWDGYEWNNNVGSFTVTIHRTGTVSLVK